MENKWTQIEGKLIKTYEFSDFKEALRFINWVGAVAEAHQHHPKIENIYNSFTLTLWTHEQNDLTDLDYQLADAIDKKMKHF